MTLNKGLFLKEYKLQRTWVFMQVWRGRYKLADKYHGSIILHP